MFYNTFLNRKIAKFQKIQVSTRLWKTQIALPYYVTYKIKEENEKKLVWTISQVLN